MAFSDPHFAMHTPYLARKLIHLSLSCYTPANRWAVWRRAAA